MIGGTMESRAVAATLPGSGRVGNGKPRVDARPGANGLNPSGIPEVREGNGDGGHGVPALPVRAFAVRIEHVSFQVVVNGTSAREAKMECLRLLEVCFGDLMYSELVSREIGEPQSNDAFLKLCRNAGWAQLRCGDDVEVHGQRATVLGHDSVGRLRVVMREGEHVGERGSVYFAEVSQKLTKGTKGDGRDGLDGLNGRGGKV